jgi:hypothetical protein
MNVTAMILTINILCYFLQFLLGRDGMTFFGGQLCLNILGVILAAIIKDNELGKAFLLSFLVLLLLGPVLVMVGGVLMFAACFFGWH